MRVAALAAVVCGLLLAAPRIISQGSSMQASIDVIRQILAKEGVYSRTTTSARNNYKSVTERKFSLSEANGCKLTVQSDTHVHMEEPTQNRVTDRRSLDIFRPDFSAMDASSIYVADPQPPQAAWETKGYLVRISVEIGKPPMVASTVDKATNEARDLPPLPMLAVYVGSRESADKLAKAFTQVAAACHAGIR
jgi:hypothetical protein